MKNLKTFEECCKYLGISEELPKCQIDERQIQALYKLRVCMNAWNKQDGFKPNETANYYQKNTGYTPHFYFKNGKLLSSGTASNGSLAGLVSATAAYATTYSYAHIGLRLCLKTQDRAVEFSKVFIDIFRELS